MIVSTIIFLIISTSPPNTHLKRRTLSFCISSSSPLTCFLKASFIVYLPLNNNGQQTYRSNDDSSGNYDGVLMEDL